MYGELTIPARFNGPPSSGNGGYSAGAFAEALLAGAPGTAQITLRKPPPLEVTMLLTEDRSQALYAGETVMDGKLIDEDIEIVEPVSYDEAVDAMTRFTGFDSHPFPGCFACGTDREDGLRIFPGRVDPKRVATTWTPDASLSDTDQVGIPIVWAALDCTSGWANGDLEYERPSVLGRMAATVDALPRVGEPLVVIGRHLGKDGRKTYTLSTVYDSDGRIIARAGAVWIEVDTSLFG
ncbi:MAG TPA: hypothetical protein VLI04_22030 [Nocardioidaceae bacterium]|nr:hypothetical protein [Nocardioidaceae bacterium]